MTIYLDTCCMVPLLIAEASSDAVVAAVDAASGLPIISDYVMGEFSSVVSRHVRTDKLSATEAANVLGAADAWAATGAMMVRIDSADLYRAIALVRRFDLKLLLPDAIHIAACANRSLTLVTTDERMADAASALGVETLVPR